MFSPQFSVLPGNLNIAVQQGMLKRRFESALRAELGYRDAAIHVPFMEKIGTTITRTRPGRLPRITTPINPATNVPLDNGLPQNQTQLEQYTTTVELWAGAVDPLCLADNETAIASLFLLNQTNLGEQAMRSLNGIVLKRLLDAYLNGQTVVDATLGAPAAAVHVNDIRGFQTVILNGVPTPTSAAATMPVTFNDGGTFTTYTLIGAVADIVNVSTAQEVGGISGTLTFSGNVTVANGTAGNAVVGAYSPTIIRPNGRAATEDLTSGDILKFSHIRAAVTALSNNAIPRINGYYNCYLSPESINQLFEDQEFQILYRGTELNGSKEYDQMILIKGLGVRFIRTNEPPIQNLNNMIIQRPFVCGEGVAIEDRFDAGMNSIISRQSGAYPALYNIDVADDIRMIVRGQIDQLALFINQAWSYIAGWAVPTDSTINSSVIRTANNSYYKRGVFIETA